MKPQSSSSQALARWSLVMQAPGTRIFHLDFLEDWPMPFLMRCCRRFTAMFFFLQHALFAFRALVLSFSLLGIDSNMQDLQDLHAFNIHI